MYRVHVEQQCMHLQQHYVDDNCLCALTAAAALLQAATSSADAPSSDSRVLRVSLYASRCAVAFFLCSSHVLATAQA
jgi:uncharacterized membrane protein